MSVIDKPRPVDAQITLIPEGKRGPKPEPVARVVAPPDATPSSTRPAPDYGPEIRQERVRARVAGYVCSKSGKRVLDKRGKPKPLVITVRVPHVTREDRPDPENPNITVRGARRRDGLMMMFRKGQMTGAQMAAAEAFRDDLAITAGARLGLPNEARSTRTRRADFHPSMRQIDAQTRCKGAWDALKPIQHSILSWVIISWGTVGGYAQCAHIRPARASARLLAALDILADFYTANSGVDAGQRNKPKSL